MSDSRPDAISPIEKHAAFATTHWSVVLSAGDAGSPHAAEALEQLCRAYWYPLYAHIRRRGHSPEDAQDLTQEFIASLLRRESLAQVRQVKGRFRTFLLASLNYFLADQSDRERALKRGGGQPAISIDALEAEERFALEPATEETPDKTFDRRWSAALLERAFERLQNEQAAAGKRRQFELLKEFLAGDVAPGDYDAVAYELGMSSNAVAAAVRRLRRRCRELTLTEAMHTVATPAEAEAELRALFG